MNTSPSLQNSDNDEQSQLESLMGRVALRDQQAFKILYDSTSSRAYSLALKMLGRAAPAQDLLQDAYLKVWSNAPNYRSDKGAVMSWLLAIVRYRALDVLRANKRRSAKMDEYGNVEEIVSSLKVTTRHEGLELCLETLADSQKSSIVEAFFYGWTYEELADRIAQPIGTVKSRIRRGLARLKECLEQ